MTPQEKRRDSYLKRKYGITSDQFDTLWDKQGRTCPICLRSDSEFSGRPHVEHDHFTGEIRSITCGYCNHRVIGRHRDPELLLRVSEYLRGPFTGLFVPGKKKKKKAFRGKKIGLRKKT